MCKWNILRIVYRFKVTKYLLRSRKYRKLLHFWESRIFWVFCIYRWFFRDYLGNSSPRCTLPPGISRPFGGKLEGLPCSALSKCIMRPSYVLMTPSCGIVSQALVWFSIIAQSMCHVQVRNLAATSNVPNRAEHGLHGKYIGRAVIFYCS